jgi:hypothetical protein
MIKFYQVVDEFSYQPSTDHGFYSDIDSIMLDRKPFALEWGHIVEYMFKEGHTRVPVQTRIFEVSTIELYELNDYLEDEPEMNENNYLVYTIESDDNLDDMLTIMKITRG